MHILISRRKFAPSPEQLKSLVTNAPEKIHINPPDNCLHMFPRCQDLKNKHVEYDSVCLMGRHFDDGRRFSANFFLPFNYAGLGCKVLYWCKLLYALATARM